MGHREALLEGARQCLYERGYARTTARDIVAASGTNLASIGYHFGSKEALLNAAMVQAIDEWGDRVKELLLRTTTSAADPLSRFEATWTRIIESFGAHRPLWVALFEVMTQAEHSPEMRTFLADAIQHGRERGVDNVQTAHPDIDAVHARALGAFFQALMFGLMALWLVDPKHSPTGHELGVALRALVAEAAPQLLADDVPRSSRGAEKARGAGKPRGAGKSSGAGNSSGAGKERGAGKPRGARKRQGDRKR